MSTGCICDDDAQPGATCRVSRREFVAGEVLDAHAERQGVFRALDVLDHDPRRALLELMARRVQRGLQCGRRRLQAQLLRVIARKTGASG